MDLSTRSTKLVLTGENSITAQPFLPLPFSASAECYIYGTDLVYVLLTLTFHSASYVYATRLVFAPASLHPTVSEILKAVSI